MWTRFKKFRRRALAAKHFDTRERVCVSLDPHARRTAHELRIDIEYSPAYLPQNFLENWGRFRILATFLPSFFHPRTVIQASIRLKIPFARVLHPFWTPWEIQCRFSPSGFLYRASRARWFAARYGASLLESRKISHVRDWRQYINHPLSFSLSHESPFVWVYAACFRLFQEEGSREGMKGLRGRRGQKEFEMERAVTEAELSCRAHAVRGESYIVHSSVEVPPL